MKIIHLSNTEINTTKWNNCIKESFNGIVYAYSWYLDIVCEEWEALIGGDYEIVMPLTTGRKYGFDYILQPLFTQQLGVFSTKKLSASIVDKFLEAIPPAYKLICINLNSFNKTNAPGFRQASLVTYELDLIKPYEKLHNKYSTNTKRNLKKALENKVSISEGLMPNSMIDLMKDNLGKKIGILKEKEYKAIRSIISFAIRHHIGKIYGAYTAENNLCAAAFFIETHNKSIFLFSDSSAEGKKNRAMFLIIDEYIQNNAEKNLTLDFEGSRIEGLARFYAGFGARACTYIQLTRNRLPWLLRIFSGFGK